MLKINERLEKAGKYKGGAHKKLAFLADADA